MRTARSCGAGRLGATGDDSRLGGVVCADESPSAGSGVSALRLSAGTATDPGRVRAVNEDKAIVADDLVAVADGMGGHAGGEVAATTAVEALRSSFARNRSVRGLLTAVEQANRAVYDQSVNDRSLRGMGTTLTAAAVVHQRSGDRVVIVNVGDSRAYLLDGSGLTRLTEDHSLVEEMVRRGELTPEQAAVHPHRHIVTRALGIDEDIEVDAWELEPQQGARLLLCSDGLTNEIADAELAAVLAERRSPPETARELVARALEHGGSDNVTVIVVDLESDEHGEHGESVDGSADEAAAETAPGEVAGLAGGAPAETGAEEVAGLAEEVAPAGEGATERRDPAVPLPGDEHPGRARSEAAAPAGERDPGGAEGAEGAEGSGSAKGEEEGDGRPADGSGSGDPSVAGAGAGGLAAGRAHAGDPMTMAVARTPGVASRPPETSASPAVRSEQSGDRERRDGRSRKSPDRAGGPGAVTRKERRVGTDTRRAGDTDAVPATATARSGRGPARAVVPATRLLVPSVPHSSPAPAPGRVRHERIMTIRVAFFVLLFAAVLGGAAVFVGWFVRASYYVGVVDGHVAILEGRPGGFLWFKPTLVERTTLAVSAVFAPTRSYLDAGMEESSLAAARVVVSDLSNGNDYLALPTGSTANANGIPTGSTLVPISSPVPTAATLPPAPPTIPAPKATKTGKASTGPGKPATGAGKAATGAPVGAAAAAAAAAAQARAAAAAQAAATAAAARAKAAAGPRRT